MLPNISKDLNHSFEIGKEIFTIRPWKTKDERNFMLKYSMVENQPNANKEKLMYEELIKPCILSGDTSSLTVDGLKRLVVELRIISNGSTLENITFKCTNEDCGKTNEFSMELEDSFEYTDFDSSFKKINDKLNIKFKPINFEKVMKIAESNNKDFEFITSSIDVIEYEDIIYESFTDKEVDEFVDNLDINSFKEIIKALAECKDNIEIKTTQKCIFCKEDNSIVIDDNNFF